MRKFIGKTGSQVQFLGQHYLVGGVKSGGNDKRQYRVTADSLEQLPDLTFGFNEGRCANINDQVSLRI